MQIKNFFLTSVMAATLVACGGGGDDAVTATPAPAPPPATTLPSAEVSATNVTLAYSVFSPSLTETSANATVNYDTTSKVGTIALPIGTSTATVSTTDGYANNVAWSGFVNSGAYRAEGNLLMLCTGNQSANTYLAITSNMVRVTDLSELNGKNFLENSCGTGGNGTFSFSASGALTITTPGDPDDTPTPAQVTAFFSDAGVTDSEGNYKGRAYKYTSNGQTKYFLGFANDEAITGNQDSVGYAEQQ